MSKTKQNLQAGDVVMLKSTSAQRMTIESIAKDYASCVWFDRDGFFRREKIETSALVSKHKSVNAG